jgi:hypothetical protein
MFEREGMTGLLYVLSFSYEIFRFTDPPAVARLNYCIREAGIFRRFSQYIFNIARMSSKARGKLTAV